MTWYEILIAVSFTVMLIWSDIGRRCRQRREHELMSRLAYERSWRIIYLEGLLQKAGIPFEKEEERRD